MRMSMRAAVVAVAAALSAAVIPTVSVPAHAAPANDYGSISGHVLRASDGTAVADIPVYIHDSLANSYVETVTTALDGGFTSDLLPPGQYQVVPAAPGLVAAGFGYRAAMVEPSTTTTGVDFSLDLASGISGVVRDASGKPIAGARVYALNKGLLAAVQTSTFGFGWTLAATQALEAQAFGAVAATDFTQAGPGVAISGSDGSFNLDGLPPDTYIVHAMTAGRAAPADATVTVGRATAIHDIVFGNGPTLYGRITDSLGNPVSGVPIQVSGGLEATYQNLPPSITAVSDHNGVYNISGLTPGYYNFTVGQNWSVLTQPFNFTVTKSTKNLRQDVVLSGRNTISGTITDVFGTPMAQVQVLASNSLYPQSVVGTTDRNGHYVLAGLPADNFHIDLARQGYFEASGTFDVATTGSPQAPSATTDDFTMQRQAWVFGRVTDPDGHPMPFVDVRNEADHSLYIPSTSEGDGSFIVTNVSPGWSLIAESPHYAATPGFTIPDTPGDTIAHLALRPLAQATVPATPTAAATGQTEQVLVTAASGDDGGNPVTQVRAIAYPGGHSCVVQLTCVITGLADNAVYTIKVYAINERGVSAPQVVTARTRLTDMPRSILSHRGKPGAAVIVFKAPHSSISIVNYRLRYFVGGKWKIYYHTRWTRSPVTVHGLVPLTTYRGTLEALLAKGKATRSQVFYFTTG